MQMLQNHPQNVGCNAYWVQPKSTPPVYVKHVKTNCVAHGVWVTHFVLVHVTLAEIILKVHVCTKASEETIFELQRTLYGLYVTVWNCYVISCYFHLKTIWRVHHFVRLVMDLVIFILKAAKHNVRLMTETNSNLLNEIFIEKCPKYSYEYVSLHVKENMQAKKAK